MPKRTMPVKTRRIELDGDFKGWWVDIRTNPPVGLLLDALIAFQQAREAPFEQSEPNEQPEHEEGEESTSDEGTTPLSELMPPIYDMLMLTIKVWNFVDEQGVDIPTTLEGIKQIPLDLLMLVAARVQGAIVSLPLVSSEPSSSPS